MNKLYVHSGHLLDGTIRRPRCHGIGYPGDVSRDNAARPVARRLDGAPPAFSSTRGSDGLPGRHVPPAFRARMCRHTGHQDGRHVGAECSEADTPGGTRCGAGAARLTI